MIQKPKRFAFSAIYWLLGLAVLLLLPNLLLQFQAKEVEYSEFKAAVKEGRVIEARLDKEVITGIMYTGPPEEAGKIRELYSRVKEKGGGRSFWSPEGDSSLDQVASRLRSLAGGRDGLILFKTVRVDDPRLTQELDAAGVTYTGVKESGFHQLFWGILLPVAFWVGLWFLLMRGMGRPGAGFLSIGKSKAKIAMEKDTGVRFSDVAGCDEAKEELHEVVEFLKEPDKFERLGAQVPKGVLLLGPPGTGKTLLAKALAGEAEVPFFTISGSEFVEMFVGVGAARVRDLFQQAKKSAPCIIFIDEIDAIGKFRGGPMVSGGHEEREQTLNQLLVEMDGFEPNIGVILLAATNRPEVLDPALLRPGRFDRQVVLDAPDAAGREAILKVHARNKPLADDVDLKAIAQRTPGFSGADLANAVNEAALLAARRGADIIAQRDFEEAVEKILAGPERKSRRLGDEERRRVAVHEAGHALVAINCPNAPPVAKISIIPRGKAALGYTMQLPDEDRFLVTKGEIEDKICVALGGSAAERLLLGEVSSGAQNDLENATELAKGMVCRFGMSELVGPRVLTRETSQFLKGPFISSETDTLSPELAAKVDKEVDRILEEQMRRAEEILSANKEALERVAEELLVNEVMSAEEFRRLALGEG